MVKRCLNDMSFALSFESYGRYEKTALTPVVCVQGYSMWSSGKYLVPFFYIGLNMLAG